MSKFNQTFWSDPDYVEDYRDNADHFIIDRQAHFFILKSFFRHFVGSGTGAKVLDLGCGDAILTEQLLSIDATIQATAIDGSGDMLTAAKERLSHYQGIRYLRKTFEELIKESADLGHYNFIISAFAIHHLDLPDKRALFQVVFNHLVPGGYFMNIDTVLPEASTYTDWYYTLYQEWIEARERQLNLSTSFSHVPDQARHNPDNKLSSLSSQLESMRAIGFTEVEYHYKYGIFVIFGGQKPG